MIVTKYQKNESDLIQRLLNKQLRKLHLVDGCRVSARGGGTGWLLLLTGQLRRCGDTFVLVTDEKYWLHFITRSRDLVENLIQLNLEPLRLHHNTTITNV